MKMLKVTVESTVVFDDFPSVGLCLGTESFWMSRSVNFISFVLSSFLLSLHCF